VSSFQKSFEHFWTYTGISVSNSKVNCWLISKKGQKEGHLLVYNQQVGQKVQKCAFGKKVGQISTYLKTQTKTCLET